jgi:GNAT superfamily N-acetyltransferase
LGEYLEGVCSSLNRQFNAGLDHRSILEQDMAELDRFSAPHGRLLLAEVDGQMAGIACLQKIGAGIGEVTRMYVRPAFRRRGIARALLEHLIEEARQIGYATIRLDTARSSPAHVLYQAAGFREIERYSESEIPQELQSMAVYMEMTLR